MAKMESRSEMLKKLRARMAERAKGKKDPDEFRPPKAKDGEKLEFLFRVLPPLEEGDTCKGAPNSVAEKTMDLWFYENGGHFVNNTKIECPRIHDKEECSICQLGFDLMEDNDDKEFRRSIARKYLARSFYAVNIYFLNVDKNPESVRGKVQWMNLPKTVCDRMEECINNDNVGDAQDPKAAGIFFHPTEGGYTFKLVVEKQGEYNNYERSDFLAASYGPLVRDSKGQPVMEKIQEILDRRFWLPTKFQPRDAKKLEEVAKKMLDREEAGGGGEGESEEIEVAPAKAPVTKPQAAPKTKVTETVSEEVAEPPAEEAAPPKAAAAKAKQKTTTTTKKEPVAEEEKVAEPQADENDPDVQNILKGLQEEQ